MCPAQPLESIYSMETRPNVTVLRFHSRTALAGTSLTKISKLLQLFDRIAKEPPKVLVLIAPSGLLGPRNLERLLGDFTPEEDENKLSDVEVRDRLIREENVLTEFIDCIRRVNSYVVGIVQGDIAFPLMAPLLACDYRIAAENTIFVNMIKKLPLVPLGALPWFLFRLVGGAKASQLLLEKQSLSALEARELGLVNHLASSGMIEEEAFDRIDRIAALPTMSLINIKHALVAACEDLQSYRKKESIWVNRFR